MRRNLVLFTICWAIVALFFVGCATKNGVIVFGGFGGPVITGVTEGGNAFVGEVVTFTVSASATSGGVLSYNWVIGTWGTIESGQGTDMVSVRGNTEGDFSGTVEVTEDPIDFDPVTNSMGFDVTIGALRNAAPVFDAALAVAPTPPATGPFTITAAFSDADGDNITVTWSADVGSIAAGAADNTSATATFTHPDEDGTAIITATINDGVNPDVTAETTIDFQFDPWAGAVQDSIFLLGAWLGSIPLDLDGNPATPAVDTDVLQLRVYGWTGVGKPLAAFDTLRVSMLKTDASFFGSSPGSYFLDNAYTGDLVSTIPPQPDTFWELGVTYGGNTFEIDDYQGVLANVLLVPPGGAATFTSGATIAFDIIDLDGSEFGRTYYTDLSSPPIKYHFATLGKDYGAGVTSAYTFIVP